MLHEEPRDALAEVEELRHEAGQVGEELFVLTDAANRMTATA